MSSLNFLKGYKSDSNDDSHSSEELDTKNEIFNENIFTKISEVNSAPLVLYSVSYLFFLNYQTNWNTNIILE
jgi:hypothetical protein